MVESFDGGKAGEDLEGELGHASLDTLEFIDAEPGEERYICVVAGVDKFAKAIGVGIAAEESRAEVAEDFGVTPPSDLAEHGETFAVMLEMFPFCEVAIGADFLAIDIASEGIAVVDVGTFEITFYYF